MTHELMTLVTRAKVRGLAAREFDAGALLAEAKKRAPDKTVFDEHDPFFWRAEVSNNRVDFYGSRMMGKSLPNFARGFADGLQFLAGHNSRNLGVGRSLAGEVVEGTEVLKDAPGENLTVQAMHADFYTLRDIQISPDLSTNSFIDAARAGIAADVSIGFTARDITCSICGEQMFMSFWSGSFHGMCEHVPGLTYQLTGKDGKPKLKDGRLVERVCYAAVNDGEAFEASTVYDGATPGAGVLKAELLAAAGKLSDGDTRQIERMFRCVLPEHRRQFRGVDTPSITATQGRGATVPTQTDATITPAGDSVAATASAPDQAATPQGTTVDLAAVTALPVANTPAEPDAEDLATRMAGVRAELGARGITVGDDPVDAIRVLGATVVDLARDAAAGRRYKASLVADALKEGVRAHPATATTPFDEATYRSILERADVDQIVRMRDDWAGRAAAQFPGGRSSVEDDAPRDTADEIARKREEKRLARAIKAGTHR